VTERHHLFGRRADRGVRRYADAPGKECDEDGPQDCECRKLELQDEAWLEDLRHKRSLPVFRSVLRCLLSAVDMR
jgi:hypothetical protein